MLEYAEPSGGYVPNFALPSCAQQQPFRHFFPQVESSGAGAAGGSGQGYTGTPPKVTVMRRGEEVGSRGSPSELSPPGGYVDSPHSASFTSAQSEMDDIIIDEILSLEEEQAARRRGVQLGSSLQTSGTIEGGPSRVLAIPGGSAAFLARQVSNSAPTSSFDMEGLVKQELGGEGSGEEVVRDRRKKDIHNMIERRRRYNINDRIKELGTMLPKHTAGDDLKLNKGTILKASVDYIRSLQKETEMATRRQSQAAFIEQQNRLMAQRIKDLESQLHQNNIPVPPAPPEPALEPGMITTPSGPQRIKEEPRDDSWVEQAAASSPSSYSTLVGISQLALDPHHTYAASPQPGDPVHQHLYQPQASSLETPPVVGYDQAPPPPPRQMQELMMDLAAGLESKAASPLLHPGDPMLPGGTGAGSLLPSGLSPEVQWDAAAFSPEAGTPSADPTANMDMSS